jgi:hypothetical protein
MATTMITKRLLRSQCFVVRACTREVMKIQVGVVPFAVRSRRPTIAWSGTDVAGPMKTVCLLDRNHSANSSRALSPRRGGAMANGR